MIRHALVDADGVLQDLPGGWAAALVPLLGDRAEEFLLESVIAEQPCLVGEGDFVALLTDQVARWGLPVDATDLYRAVWHRIEVHADTMALVQELRSAGIGVHLASTQEAGRAAVMRGLYDGNVDSAYFSCDLGVAKPDPEFFRRILSDLGAAPGDVFFVDDTEVNVEGARTVGLHAMHWRHEDGLDRLRSSLAAFGLPVAR
ncbi:MAG: HAD-IA family hydrolase [Nocardioides sp.]